MKEYTACRRANRGGRFYAGVKGERTREGTDSLGKDRKKMRRRHRKEEEEGSGKGAGTEGGARARLEREGRERRAQRDGNEHTT